jgi:hypothetical protein
MSAETKEYLVGVVLVLLAVIALICARPDSVEHADSDEAPSVSVTSDD